MRAGTRLALILEHAHEHNRYDDDDSRDFNVAEFGHINGTGTAVGEFRADSVAVP